MTLLPPAQCPACDRPPRLSWKLRNGARLRRCPECGLGWWGWPPFEPAAFYDRDYFQSAEAARGYNDYASLEPGLRRTARGRMRRLQQLLTCSQGAVGARPRLLDIGCGTGIFLDEAVRAGWDVAGIETSPYAAAEARRRGVDVTCDAAEGVAPAGGEFDVVTLWDVIEHLRDPLGVLRSAARALKPGGVLALSTGDLDSACARLSGARWHLFNLPEHLFFFTPAALRGMLAKVGLEVVQVTRETNWVPVSYLLERLGKMVGLAPGLKPGAPRCGARAPSSPAAPPSPGLQPGDLSAGNAPPSRFGSRVVLPATLLDVLGVYARKRPAER